MSHIKDKLMQYEDEYLKYSKYDGLYVADRVGFRSVRDCRKNVCL